jgi:ribokinase
MSKILVSGLINIETTLRVESFPLTYEPVRFPFFGINSTVSGVGYNVAKALTTLGNDLDFLSIIGKDFAGESVRRTLARDEISDDYIISSMPTTAQSVIIYEHSGRRQIHTDLKDIQERKYPAELYEKALQRCSIAILCNINFNRPFLEQTVRANIPVATDVHTISDIEDAYNQDFMAAAHILFLSDEHLPCSPEEFAGQLQDRYGTPIIVIGLGSQGALLASQTDGTMDRYQAVNIRPIVNTIGAGDALFSSFMHTYLHTGDPYAAIQRGIVFASYKIGESGAAEGFLTAGELDELTHTLRHDGSI